VIRSVAPLVLVACSYAAPFPRAIDERAISYLQTAQTILVLHHPEVVPAELFGGGEGNIHG
jgi:hypothetical protein